MKTNDHTASFSGPTNKKTHRLDL